MTVSILKEPPITVREATIPYAMAGLNLLASIIVARNALDLPMVFLTAVTLVLIGLPLSVYFRIRQYHPILLNILVQIPLWTITWALVRSHPGLHIDWSNPVDSLMTQDVTESLTALLHVFVMLASGQAFLLVSTRALLQTPVPSLGIFLLAVITSPTSGRDIISLLCLLLLLASTLYLFCEEHSQRWFTIHTPQRVQRKLMAWTFWGSLALFPLVIAIGFLLQGFNLSDLSRSARRRPMPTFQLPDFLTNRMTVSLDDSVTIGGANWTRGKQVIMEVDVSENAPSDLLWRGGTYTRYAKGGKWLLEWPEMRMNAAERGWELQSDTPPRLLRPIADPFGDPGIRSGLAAGKIDLDAQTVVQRFTVHANILGNARTPIYGAYQVNAVSSEIDLRRVHIARDGSIAFKGTVPTSGDMIYEVASVIKPLPTTFKLSTPMPLSQRAQAGYLQMPGGNMMIPGQADGAYVKQIRKKALEILADRNISPTDDPFAVVRQLSLYLSSNYRYTLTPSPPEKNRDPIIDFLFYQKRGYCNYFAGSMTMLCRSLGIPARFVVGFATGEQVENDPNIPPGITRYRVQADHAHSWTEVYLPNYGWYTIDPTAGSVEEPNFLSITWDVFLTSLSNMKATIGEWWARYGHDRQFRGYVHLGIAVLLTLSALAFYFRREGPPRLPKRPLTPEEARHTVEAAYARMHRWLKMWGVYKPDGLTATEFEQYFHTLNPTMGALVHELSHLYVRARYAAEPITDTDGRQAVELLWALWEMSRTERRNLRPAAVEE